MAEPETSITALILAGGQGQRMGGKDKGLMLLNGRPLYRHVIDHLVPQIEHILISANRHQDEYATAGFPVLSDEVDGFQGPLAGILTGLKAIKGGLLLVLPCDSPRFPADLIEKLSAAQQRHPDRPAVAHDGQRLQPLFALIPKSCSADLEAYLGQGKQRAGTWFQQQSASIVQFPQVSGEFFNANTPEEFAKLADNLS